MFVTVVNLCAFVGEWRAACIFVRVLDGDPFFILARSVGCGSDFEWSPYFFGVEIKNSHSHTSPFGR